MGNDGGSIPKRRELVKEAARNPTTAELKETLQEKQTYYWTTDPLSNKSLREPIVSDCTGKLYNKDSILEYLLSGEDEVKKAEWDNIIDGSVKSLKDIVEVRFEAESNTEHISNGNARHWKCPITGKRLGPQTKSVYLVPCGHAFSAVAVKELAEEVCQKCSEPYAPNDVIPIIPTSDEDLARLLLRSKTLAEKGLTHSLKKAAKDKKRKKGVDKDVAQTITNGENGTSDGIKNTATASLTAKVLEEQEERNKKRKTEQSANVASLFTNKDIRGKGKGSDFMNRGYTIPAGAKR